MKVGDLVNFHTDAWVFENAKKDYQNPGVVLEVYPGAFPKRFSAEVYWSDGKVSREHDCYLELIELDRELTMEELETVRGGMTPATFEDYKQEVLLSHGILNKVPK